MEDPKGEILSSLLTNSRDPERGILREVMLERSEELESGNGYLSGTEKTLKAIGNPMRGQISKVSCPRRQNLSIPMDGINP